MSSLDMPRRLATAIAAVALEMLWRPGMGMTEIVEPDNLPGPAAADLHVEDRTRTIDAHIHEAHVGLRVFTIGDDLAILDPTDQRLHLRDGRGT